MSTRIRRLFSVIVVCVFGFLTACQAGVEGVGVDDPTAEPSETSQPSDATGVQVSGNVALLQRDGVTRACFTFAESLPPSCEGITVQGEIPWSELDSAQYGEDAHWADAYVEGTLDGDMLTISRVGKLTEPQPALQQASEAADDAALDQAAAAIDAVLERYGLDSWHGYSEVNPQSRPVPHLQVNLLIEDPVVVEIIREAASRHILAGALTIEAWLRRST